MPISEATLERNNIVALVKDLVASTDFMYDNSMEREFTLHIQRNKLLNESWDGLGISRLELLRLIIGYVKTNKYWISRVTSVKTLYYSIPKLINEMIEKGILLSPKKAKESRERQNKLNALFSQTTVEGYIETKRT